MSKKHSANPFLISLLAVVLGVLAMPALAQTQGSSSAGQTTSQSARALRAPQPVDELVVTAVDVDQAKIKLRHNRQGWEHWFELNDDTVIRSEADKKQLLQLDEVKAGDRAEVYVARKLLGGRTVYLTVDNT